MSEQALDVVFCDLCEVSVSVAELASGAAIRHRGKVIGPCCLGALRSGAPAAAPSSAGPASAAASSASADGRIFPIAIVLLAAVAAATIFLDQRFTSADSRWQKGQEQLFAAQQEQGQLLQRVDMAADAAVRRVDLDALQTRLQELAAGLPRSEDVTKQLGALAQELAAARQDVRGVAEREVDYRPLFDEQRGRQQRMLELLATLREAAANPAPAPAPTVVPPPEQPVDASTPANSLPPALAAQVAKLKSAEASVRFVAVDELFRSKNADVLVHLLPMAKDADPFVRRLTIDGLRDHKRADVVEVLLAGLADADENVRDTAWGSLKILTGQKLPFEATGSKDVRARALGRWQEWWDKNKATFGS